MPDISFDTLDGVPEGLREHAKEVNGKLVVKVVPQIKLDEFRNNNVALATERDALKTRNTRYLSLVGDDDAAFEAELTEMRSIAQQVKDGKLKGTVDVESEVGRRVASMKGDFDRQLQEKANEAKAWQTKASDADSKFRRSLIERAVTDAVLNEKSGAEARALPDIIGRALSVFQVDDSGKLTPRDGEAVIYGSDGASPMTPLEWLAKLRDAAPYFFKNSSGGGASGGQSGQSFGGLSKADFNKLPASQRLALARKNNL